MTQSTILLPTLLIHTLTTTMTLPQKIIHRQRVLFHLHVVAVAILPIQLMVVVMMTTMEGAGRWIVPIPFRRKVRHPTKNNLCG